MKSEELSCDPQAITLIQGAGCLFYRGMTSKYRRNYALRQWLARASGPVNQDAKNLIKQAAPAAWRPRRCQLAYHEKFLDAGHPGDTANVGACDAQIGQITVRAGAQLVKILPVLAILVNTIAKAHGLTPFICPP